jgi:predicted kinase
MTLTINLPDSLREFVQGSDDPEQLVLGLLRAAQEEEAQIREWEKANRDELERKLTEGLESGAPIVADDAWWERWRAELVNRFGRAETSASVAPPGLNHSCNP